MMLREPRARDAAPGGHVLDPGHALADDVLRLGRGVAVVPGVPGPVSFLGRHADRCVRGVRPGPAGHAAVLRIGVGLPGPAPGDHRRARLQRGRMRDLPGRARHRGPLSGQVPAGHRDRAGQRADRGRADRPAATGQPASAPGNQRLLHPWPGPGRADHQRARPVRPGADPPDLVGIAGRLRGRHRRRAGHGRARGPASRCPGLAPAPCR